MAKYKGLKNASKVFFAKTGGMLWKRGGLLVFLSLLAVGRTKAGTARCKLFLSGEGTAEFFVLSAAGGLICYSEGRDISVIPREGGKMRSYALELLGLIFIGAMSSAYAQNEDQKEEAPCPAAREFITAFEYLSDKDTTHLAKAPATELSLKVAKGCEGAAERFITTSELLRRSGLFSQDALKLGLEFAKATPAQTEAFRTIFQMAFLREGLDLDLLSATQLARSLSLDFSGQVEQAMNDYEQLVEFCLSKEALGLPRPRCATLSAELVPLARERDVSIFAIFRDGYEFLTGDSDGPKLSTDQALSLLVRLLKMSPEAVSEFAKLYPYAHDADGLGLSRQQAIELALEVSSSTKIEPEAQKAQASSSPGASPLFPSKKVTEAMGP